MKNFAMLCITIGTLTLLPSCNSEEPFACDDNAPITVNGENICGKMRVERHVVSTDLDPTEYEILNMRLDFSGVFRVLGVTLTGKTIQEGTTYTPLEASYGGDGLSGSVEITFTKFDRDARKISGHFSFSGEYYNQSAATSSDRTESGTFTDVSY